MGRIKGFVEKMIKIKRMHDNFFITASWDLEESRSGCISPALARFRDNFSMLMVVSSEINYIGDSGGL
ncbi:MAG: hypothetical protein JSV27_07670 [Candidatus Bathyarchaeota archaeon]|nr:MAG: hypothetical protein JSV27_07670 [Candidatus Bathyarchaeota archaeon]